MDRNSIKGGDMTDQDYKDLSKNIKNLLWNIGNQPEKVSGCLVPLIDVLYPGFDERYKIMIKAIILKNIGECET